MRHTWQTRAWEPRVLQAQLGHADAATTLNLYGQVLPESQRRAVEGLERVLLQNQDSKGANKRYGAPEAI